jgi:hypothetical protein
MRTLPSLPAVTRRRWQPSKQAAVTLQLTSSGGWKRLSRAPVCGPVDKQTDWTAFGRQTGCAATTSKPASQRDRQQAVGCYAGAARAPGVAGAAWQPQVPHLQPPHAGGAALVHRHHGVKVLVVQRSHNGLPVPRFVLQAGGRGQGGRLVYSAATTMGCRCPVSSCRRAGGGKGAAGKGSAACCGTDLRHGFVREGCRAVPARHQPLVLLAVHHGAGPAVLLVGPVLLRSGAAQGAESWSRWDLAERTGQHPPAATAMCSRFVTCIPCPPNSQA